MKPFLSKSLNTISLNDNPDSIASSSLALMDSNLYSDALAGFNRCLDISKNLSLDNRYIADVLANIGICHSKLGNYHESVSNFVNSYKLFANTLVKIKFWEVIGSDNFAINSSQMKVIHNYIEFMAGESEDFYFEKYSTRLLYYYLQMTGFDELFYDEKNFDFLTYNFSDFNDDDSRRFFTHEFVLNSLSTELIKDVYQERLFSKIRYELLKLCVSNKITKKNIVPSFILALSKQNALNEYISVPSDDEVTLLQSLIKGLNLSAENLDDNLFKISLISCYSSLVSSLNSTRDIITSYNGDDKNFKEILKLHFLDQDKIIEIKRKYLSDSNVDTINSNITLNIKNQYEDRPFPTWSALKVSPNLKYNHYDYVFNTLNLKSLDEPSNIKNVLIAGCGTGQHGILRALECKDINFTAIDISSTSLAFAIKKAQDLNLSNIKFYLDDINTFSSNEFKFDVIECVGVLHHLEDPLFGLKNLKKSLTDEGLLLLGLYSKISRNYMLSFSRRIISDHMLDKSDTSVYKFRDLIINSQNSSSEFNNLQISKLQQFRDFFSLSGLRDLLFNEHEIEFTIDGIETLIKDAGMEFFNFQFRDFSSIKLKMDNFSKKSSLKLAPSSLKNWSSFENEYPGTFIEMYLIWLRKSDI
tara:strand:+ start:452 stop:2377 length:1926 start_codon:yes stop_codon:yes gene_type:complete